MILSIREMPDRIIVYIVPVRIIDVFQIQEITKGLREVSEQAKNDGKMMIVDFRNTSFMPSAMIGELVLLNNSHKKHSSLLRLANINANILEVFRLMGLGETFITGDDDDPEMQGSLSP